MITTLTLNPSLDRTVSVERLERGEVQRIQHVSSEAGGKGVNVTKALTANGVESLAVLPIGGFEGGEVELRLRTAGVRVEGVPIAGAVRSNISVIEPDGTTTKLNEPGPTLSAAEVEILLEAATRGASGDWVVASGSIPPGVPADVYASLAEKVSSLGGRLAVDTSGPALEACRGARIALLKPNLHELRQVASSNVATLGDAVDAGRELVDGGIAQVLISLGESGCALVDGDGAVHGALGKATVQNSVGAGDALLAGFLAGGAAGTTALAVALAWANAALRSPGTAMVQLTDDDHAAVVIHDSLDRSLELVE
ncbi:MAG: 1-phosphofructokinase family hexose kinase [Acidimicrobiia bacterium]|nr:1-phosphofructokinase family hexose kinase [Acidimicrobiia bacterium]